MNEVVSLLDRPVYGFGQVDRILALSPGTSRRWIDGYERGGREFAPVVRPSTSGDESVTWGEFVETRLLAEYRGKGVPLIRMRPAVLRLRDQLGTRYPLASAQVWLSPEGRELVREVEDQVSTSTRLRIVVRNGQGVLDWSPEAREFSNSADWTDSGNAMEVRYLRPVSSVPDVRIDPLASFGEPVVRGVRTEIIAELVRAGDSPAMIAELYELPLSVVNAAVRYELVRASAA